jgi:drug/metabolite transporter (DMT)-like permease
MPQIYVLSILANAVAGLTLAGDYFGARMPFLASFKNLRERRSAVIWIGVVTAVIGVLKLIVLSPRETVPVAGDLLPALGGVALGVMLLAEQLVKPQAEGGEKIEKVAGKMLTYRVPVGIAGVVISLVHFLFPGAVIL